MNLLSRVKGNTPPATQEPGDGRASRKDPLPGLLQRDQVFRPFGFDDPAASPSARSRQDIQGARHHVPTLSLSRVATSEEAQTRFADLLFNAHRLGGSDS